MSSNMLCNDDDVDVLGLLENETDENDLFGFYSGAHRTTFDEDVSMNVENMQNEELHASDSSNGVSDGFLSSRDFQVLPQGTDFRSFDSHQQKSQDNVKKETKGEGHDPFEDCANSECDNLEDLVKTKIDNSNPPQVVSNDQIQYSNTPSFQGSPYNPSQSSSSSNSGSFGSNNSPLLNTYPTNSLIHSTSTIEPLAQNNFQTLFHLLNRNPGNIPIVPSLSSSLGEENGTRGNSLSARTKIEKEKKRIGRRSKKEIEYDEKRLAVLERIPNDQITPEQKKERKILRNRKSAKKSRVEKKKKEEEMDRKIRAAEKERDKTKKENEVLQNENKQLRIKCENLYDSNCKVEREMELLKKNTSILKKENLTSNEKNNHWELNCRKLQEEVSFLREENQNLSHELQTIKNENMTYFNENLMLRDQLKQFQPKGFKLNSTILLVVFVGLIIGTLYFQQSISIMSTSKQQLTRFQNSYYVETNTAPASRNILHIEENNHRYLPTPKESIKPDDTKTFNPTAYDDKCYFRSSYKPGFILNTDILEREDIYYPADMKHKCPNTVQKRTTEPQMYHEQDENPDEKNEEIYYDLDDSEEEQNINISEPTPVPSITALLPSSKEQEANKKALIHKAQTKQKRHHSPLLEKGNSKDNTEKLFNSSTLAVLDNQESSYRKAYLLRHTKDEIDPAVDEQACLHLYTDKIYPLMKLSKKPKKNEKLNIKLYIRNGSVKHNNPDGYEDVLETWEIQAENVKMEKSYLAFPKQNSM